METVQIVFEQQSDGTWRATWEDLYHLSGWGDNRYEALENLMLQIEDVLTSDDE